MHYKKIEADYSARSGSKPAKPRAIAAALLLAGSVAAIPFWAADAQVVPGAAAGVLSYTADQSSRGEDDYADHCAGCHGATLGGEGEAPALIGSGFRERWFANTAQEFFVFITEAMPQQAPGTLEPPTYADIMAYILDRNGYPAGEAELPADPALLATMTFPARPD